MVICRNKKGGKQMMAYFAIVACSCGFMYSLVLEDSRQKNNWSKRSCYCRKEVPYFLPQRLQHFVMWLIDYSLSLPERNLLLQLLIILLESPYVSWPAQFQQFRLFVEIIEIVEKNVDATIFFFITSFF